MGLSIKARHVVKPSQPTWNGTISLSELDQIGVITHTTLIYIYNKPTQDSFFSSYNKIITTLMGSLSQALVQFYPVAGRINWLAGGRLELECNAKGVELIEAEFDKPINHFIGGDKFSCLVPNIDYKKPVEEIPLFLVQVTRFKCGGIGLGTAMCHAITDGLGAFHFHRKWAELAQGEYDQLGQDLPYLDRLVLQARKDSQHDFVVDQQVDCFSRLPKLVGKENDFEERKKETMAKTLVLTKSHVERLKKVANEGRVNDGGRRYGRFEVVAAHVWRCATKARWHKIEQVTALCFCVDVRSRMDPPLPPRYFGNAIIDVVATSQVRELLSQSLSHACRRIREVKEKVTNNYICSMIEFLKTQKSLVKYQDRSAFGINTEGVFYGNPNLGVASWLNLPVRNLDFGWGNEIYVGPGNHDFDGDVMILPGYDNDGSVVITIGLQVMHMEKFKKHFYEDIDDET